MRRVLLEWRGARLYSYPAMLYLGLTVGIAVSSQAASTAGLESSRVVSAMLLLTVPALVGARLLFVASHFDRYRRNPKRIWERSEGGAAVYGGLLGALAASVPVLGALGIPLGTFWDVATFGMCVGVVLTKVGCLLNGCCAGRAWDGPLATYLPDSHGYWTTRVPSQLLEAGLAMLLLFVAVASWDPAHSAGRLFLASLAGYGLARIALESTRQAQNRLFGRVTLQHLLSGCIVGVAMAALLAAWLAPAAQ